jgi:hypothetical protein
MPNYVLSERDYLALKRDHFELRRMMTNLRSSVSRAPRGKHQPRSSGDKSAIVQAWSTSGSPTVGDILQQNSDGLHPGRIRTLSNATWTSQKTVWIKFVDWEADAGAVYTAHGRYFAGVLSGTFTSSGTTAPLYLCQAGEQSFLAQTTSAPGKGNTGTYKLYHASESDSTFTQAAKAKGADTPINKWCNVWRNHAGVWYAGPWEC